MLTKLLFLLLYFVLLFVVLRILELAAWYEVGFLACQLVDPLSLSVKKLKTILDERGVGYNGVFEKHELSELVTSSGELTEGESLTVTSSQDDESSSQSTSFTCGAHFNEEVEDKKDSVWIVQVIPKGQYAYLTDPTWSMLIKKISRFGIRTGVFDCTLDSRFCARKGWRQSNVIIALPLGQKPKDNVAMITYNGPSKLQPVLSWINDQLSSRINVINTEDELKSEWLERSTTNKIVLFSHMRDPPMFYSTLSIKFSGRFKFGKYSVDNMDYDSFLKNTGVTKLPTFLVVMPESTFQYGARGGEFPTYKSMEIFLKAFQPEINDVFLISLVVVNTICCMDIFLSNSTLLRRFLKLLWELGKYNVITIILWIPILRILQLSCMDSACKLCYKVLRIISGTEFACLVRRDWILYGDYTSLLLLSFIAYGIAVNITRKKCGYPRPSADDNLNVTEWWNQTMQQCYNLLIRTSPTFRTRGPNDVHLMETGLDLLIERLAVPELWLNPLVSNEYIKDLPVWGYSSMMQQKCEEEESTTYMCCCLKRKIAVERDDDINLVVVAKRCCGDDDDDCCCRLQNHCVMHARHKSAEMIREMHSDTNQCCCEKSREKDDRTNQDLRNSDNEGSCDENIDAIEPSPSTTEEEKSTLFPDNANSHDAPSFEQPPPGMIENHECAICLDSYDLDSVLCGLPCGHNYHQPCIVQWLHSRSRHCCPICRWPAYKTKGSKLPQHRE